MKFDSCGSASCWLAARHRVHATRVSDFNHSIQNVTIPNIFEINEARANFQPFQQAAFGKQFGTFGTKQLGLCMIVSGRARISIFFIFYSGLENLTKIYFFSIWNLFFIKHYNFSNSIIFMCFSHTLIFLTLSHPFTNICQHWIKAIVWRIIVADKTILRHVRHISSTLK